jgi:hypothetical protein
MNERALLRRYLAMLIYYLLKSKLIVDADEGRGDVGLLAQVRETETRECRGVVHDRRLVLCAEPR